MITDGVILIEEERIITVGQKKNIQIPQEYEVINFKDRILSPGFIDIHIHGALGCFVQDSPEAALKIADYIVKSGTTSFLPTIQAHESISKIKSAKKLQDNEDHIGADIAGIHMEGLFLPKNNSKNIEI